MQARIIGSSQIAIARAKALPEALMRGAAIGLDRGLRNTAGYAERTFLRGPRPARLDVRTGRLASSLATKVDSSPTRIVGRIGTNIPYAGYHEFGFHGTEAVRAHTRVISQTSAKGIAIDDRRQAFDLTFVESRKKAAGRQRTGSVGVQFVKAHSRTVNYKGRPFLNPALEANLGMIKQQVQDEMGKV